jgi:hypothetical protein
MNEMMSEGQSGSGSGDALGSSSAVERAWMGVRQESRETKGWRTEKGGKDSAFVKQ